MFIPDKVVVAVNSIGELTFKICTEIIMINGILDDFFYVMSFVEIYVIKREVLCCKCGGWMWVCSEERIVSSPDPIILTNEIMLPLSCSALQRLLGDAVNFSEWDMGLGN